QTYVHSHGGMMAELMLALNDVELLASVNFQGRGEKFKKLSDLSEVQYQRTKRFKCASKQEKKSLFFDLLKTMASEDVIYGLQLNKRDYLVIDHSDKDLVLMDKLYKTNVLQCFTIKIDSMNKFKNQPSC